MPIFEYFVEETHFNIQYLQIDAIRILPVNLKVLNKIFF